jgi:hypothetical protein
MVVCKSDYRNLKEYKKIPNNKTLTGSSSGFNGHEINNLASAFPEQLK